MSTSLLAFIDGPEGIVVLVVLVLVFGANRVPKLARQLGQAQRELKKGMQEGFSGEHDDDKRSADATSTTNATSSPASQLATNIVDTTAAEQPPVVELPVARPSAGLPVVAPPALAEPVVVVIPANLRPPLPPPPS